MRRTHKAAISATCVVVLCGAVLWHIYKTKVNERTIAKQAQDCRIRAEQGDAKSEYDLGSKYYYGIGMPQDYAEAVRWYRKAANHGYPTAELALGLVYHLGHGVEQNDAEAVRWYIKAAGRGNLDAQNYLAFMYYNGYGVAQDYSQALFWYHKADEQHSAYAETEIGRMYYHGQGVPQDYPQAFNWYRKAANQGYAPAEYDLGFMLYYGYGARRNLFDAHRWFRKAAVQGDQRAVKAISINPGRITEIALIFELVGGLFLSTSFVSLNKFDPATNRGDPKRQLKVITGVVWIFSVGFSWYGYTHHKMWLLVYGPNAFTVVARLLGGVVLVLLYFVLVDRKPRKAQAPMVAGEVTVIKDDDSNI